MKAESRRAARVELNFMAVLSAGDLCDAKKGWRQKGYDFGMTSFVDGDSAKLVFRVFFDGDSSGSAGVFGRENGSMVWTHCDPSPIFAAWTPRCRFLIDTVDACSALKRWIYSGA